MSSGMALRRWCTGRYVLSFSDQKGVRTAAFCVGPRRCRKPAPCGVAGGLPVLVGPSATVLQTVRIPPGAGLYACRAGAAKPILLESTGGYTYAGASDIDGEWVAWESTFSFGGFSTTTPKARNLRTGETRTGSQTRGATRSFVTYDGILAYGASPPPVSSTDLGIVRLIDATGATTLASGGGVEGATLARSGRLLFWRENGLARSHELPVP